MSRKSTCTVLTASRSPGIGDGLTYEAHEPLKPGVPVRVPLREKTVEGIVLDVTRERRRRSFRLREIKERLDRNPLLTRAQLKTLCWMAEEYACSRRQALSAFLPPPPWSRLLPPSVPANPPCSVRRPKLTQAQQQAYEAITGDKRPSLLFGITSSGKTEIYAQLIADAIEAGKQAILLLPEILLAEYFIRRFERLVDRECISVIHSRLTPRKRREEWKRIHGGSVRLVVGSRSALFAPCRDLGLVILDEEHEWTYKNEQAPRYHARETAEELCRNAGAKLVFGTATPSLEAWHRAKTGTYRLAELQERYGKRALPSVRVIDLADVHFGDHYPFSPPLLEAIEERLGKSEQSVLFLNRRGVATALLCFDCRRRVVSPDSALPFTVHRSPAGQPFLMDHTTGAVTDVPAACPHCRSANLRAVGAGTHRIEDILAERFPRARVLRADRDTLARPEQVRLLLSEMREGRADILLGTQSVVKGLDLPQVTLAAVLLADIGLSLPHFRAGERVFQLLTQLSGRSGRARAGEVIIQTFRPAAPEVALAAAHRTREYLEQELRLREHFSYPPALRMVRLLYRGKDARSRAESATATLHKTHPTLKVGCSATLFGGGREWQVLLRGKNPRDALSTLPLDGVSVDVDPVECV